MAMNKTTNFGFPKPAKGDAGDAKLTEYNNLLDAADVLLSALLSDVVEDPSPQLGGDLEYNNKNLVHAIPGSDVSANGDIIAVTVDTNGAGVGAPLFMAADGHMDTADADSEATAPCVAIAVETGTGTKKVLLRGVIRNDAWNWTTGPGKSGLIYLSATEGTLCQFAGLPTGTDNVWQIVGFALSAHVMYFNPQYDYLTHV